MYLYIWLLKIKIVFLQLLKKHSTMLFFNTIFKVGFDSYNTKVLILISIFEKKHERVHILLKILLQN